MIQFPSIFQSVSIRSHAMNSSANLMSQSDISDSQLSQAVKAREYASKPQPYKAQIAGMKAVTLAVRHHKKDQLAVDFANAVLGEMVDGHGWPADLRPEITHESIENVDAGWIDTRGKIVLKDEYLDLNYDPIAVAEDLISYFEDMKTLVNYVRHKGYDSFVRIEDAYDYLMSFASGTMLFVGEHGRVVENVDMIMRPNSAGREAMLRKIAGLPKDHPERERVEWMLGVDYPEGHEAQIFENLQAWIKSQVEISKAIRAEEAPFYIVLERAINEEEFRIGLTRDDRMQAISRTSDISRGHIRRAMKDRIPTTIRHENGNKVDSPDLLSEIVHGEPPSLTMDEASKLYDRLFGDDELDQVL